MTVSIKKSRAAASTYYTEFMDIGNQPEGSVVSGKSGTIDDGYAQTVQPLGVFYAGPSPATGSRNNLIGVNDGQSISVLETEGFANLVRGFHPETHARLVQNAGSSPRRVAFFDFTTSAPKSISAVWSQADQKVKRKIEQAQLNASRKFLDILSTKAYSRQSKGGTIKTPVALLAAQWPHASSRAGDPQLHTHNTVFNLSERPLDQSTGAIEVLEMMRWLGAAASIYHADLAFSLKLLKFSIERNGNLFEISGLPKNVVKHFSKRRQQIVDAVEKDFFMAGLDPSDCKHYGGIFDKAAIETRSGKSKVPREQLQQIWNSDGQKLSFGETQVAELMTEEFRELSDSEAMVQARSVIDELSKSNAFFSAALLLTKIAIHLTGLVSTEKIMSVFSNLKNQELLVSSTSYKLNGNSVPVFSTIEQLANELEMTDLAESLSSRRRDNAGVVDASALDREQHSAAIAASTSGDLTLIDGVDDFRRSSVVDAVAKLFLKNGYKISSYSSIHLNNIGLSPLPQRHESSMCSVEFDIHPASPTIDDAKWDKKSLIFVDDVNLIGSREIHWLLSAAWANNSKIVFLGDSNHSSPTANCDSMRLISERIGSSRLGVVRNQADERERQSVLHFLDGRAREGLQPYLAKGQVHLHIGREATHKQMVLDFMNARKGQPVHSTLMIAINSATALELNRLVHEDRKKAGELLEGLSLLTMDSGKTRTSIEFCVGDRVQLRVNRLSSPGYDPNRSHGVVEKISGDTICVRLDQGHLERIDVNDKKWQHKTAGGLALQHGYCLTTYSCRGKIAEKILFIDEHALDRSHASIGMAMHRGSCDIYVDKQRRYEAKMKRSSQRDWVPLRQFSDNDCIEEVVMDWSSIAVKRSTLDFESWTRGGLPVDAKTELLIVKSKRASRVKPLNSDQVRNPGHLADLPIYEELLFQRVDSYILKIDPPSFAATQTGLNMLAEMNMTDAAVNEAIRQGTIGFDENGRLQLFGQRPDGQIVCIYSQDSNNSTSPLRRRYPPIFHGEDDEVAIVATGEEALALWSRQTRQHEKRTTIIVRSEGDQSLGLAHIRKIIGDATSIRRYDRKNVCQTDVNDMVPEAKTLSTNFDHLIPPKELAVQKYAGTDRIEKSMSSISDLELVMENGKSTQQETPIDENSEGLSLRDQDRPRAF